MAARKLQQKLEGELESARRSQDWDKTVDTVKSYASRLASSGLADYGDLVFKLVQGEKSLEDFLLNNASFENNTEQAKSDLKTAEVHLKQASQCKIPEKDWIWTEATILLSKLLFVQGRHKEAQTQLSLIQLNELSSKQGNGNRLLKLVAEGFALKGLCTDILLDKRSENVHLAEESIVANYEEASNVLLVYLQQLEKVSGLPSSSTLHLSPSSAFLASEQHNNNDCIGPILETALQKSCLFYIVRNDVQKSIDRYRRLLRIVETKASQNLRLTLARQLAEILIRGVSPESYVPLLEEDAAIKNSPNLPKTYFHSSSHLQLIQSFKPANDEEEAILLLQIAESIAYRNAVLERSPQHQSAREHALSSAVAIYDLMTIAMVRRGHYGMLSEALERAMKFSFKDFHVWHQSALCLVQTKKYKLGFLFLQECLKIKPGDVNILILQANICHKFLRDPNQCISIALQAVEHAKDDITQAQAQSLVGLGYHSKATESRTQKDRAEFRVKALDAFQLAHNLDRHSLLPCLYLALQHADLRNISEAVQYASKALAIDSEHLPATILLSLLFTCRKEYAKAYTIISMALREYPDTMSLLFVKSKLEQVMGSHEEAFITCQDMLRLWQDNFEASCQDVEHRGGIGMQCGTGLIDRFIMQDGRAGPLSVKDMTDDTTSLRVSLAASQVEKALSEVNSSLEPFSGASEKNEHGHSWVLQAQIWLHLGEIYMSSDKLPDASACINEVLSISQLSHQGFYMKGRISEKEGKIVEAKSYYEAALAINPYHVKSLQYLGRLIVNDSRLKLAEKMLRDAVNIDPGSFFAWRELGVVLETLGEHEVAANCFLTAVRLEGAAPVMPFNIVLSDFH